MYFINIKCIMIAISDDPSYNFFLLIYHKTPFPMIPKLINLGIVYIYLGIF